MLEIALFLLILKWVQKKRRKPGDKKKAKKKD